MKYIFNEKQYKLTIGKQKCYNINTPNRLCDYKTDNEVKLLQRCNFYGRGGKAECNIRLIS